MNIDGASIITITYITCVTIVVVAMIIKGD